MNNFTYQMPTRIYFGRDKQKLAGSLAAQYGKKVLLHYGGGSIKKSGLYDQVVSSLKDAGCEVCELGGVVPNPKLSFCRAGIELCRKEQIDFILAVGGGSVIDSAKCIALGTYYDGDIWDFFLDQGEKPRKALPIGAISTLPASGSENNGGMVITNEETKLKIGRGNALLFPKFAILNPELTFTLPPYQSAAGAVDTISHALISYFEKGWTNELMHSIIESIIKVIIHNVKVVLKNPNDYEARAQLLWAATICCNGSLHAGSETDVTTHRIQYELGAYYDITHGAGLAVTIPAWLKFLKPEVPDRLARLGTRVFGYEYDFAHPENSADECIKRFESFFKSIGMPTRLSDLNIPDAHFETMAQKIYDVFGEYGAVRKCGVKESLELFQLCL